MKQIYIWDMKLNKILILQIKHCHQLYFSFFSFNSIKIKYFVNIYSFIKCHWCAFYHDIEKMTSFIAFNISKYSGFNFSLISAKFKVIFSDHCVWFPIKIMKFLQNYLISSRILRLKLILSDFSWKIFKLELYNS